MNDIRDDIFKDILRRCASALIIADDSGIIAGTRKAEYKKRHFI